MLSLINWDHTDRGQSGSVEKSKCYRIMDDFPVYLSAWSVSFAGRDDRLAVRLSGGEHNLNSLAGRPVQNLDAANWLSCRIIWDLAFRTLWNILNMHFICVSK